MRISDWSSDVCSSDLLLAETKAGNMGGCCRFRCHWRRCRNWPLGDDSMTSVFRHVRKSVALPPTELPAPAALSSLYRSIVRSEERRVGKACVSNCRSRWSPYHSQKKKL